MHPDLAAAIALFPETFGLREFGGTFRVSRTASYMGDDGKPVLYTECKILGGGWQDFAKGSVAELMAQMVAK